MLKYCGCTLIWLVVISVLLPAQTSYLHLKRVIGVASENGTVAVDGSTVSSFSSANIRLQDVDSLQWKLAAKRDDAVSVIVEGARWRELVDCRRVNVTGMAGI